MSVLTELGSVLQTAGVGTVGTSIFLSGLPMEPVTAVGLMEYGGAAPQWTFNQIAWEQPRVQVQVRSVSGYAAARTLARQAWDALAAIRNQSISGIWYMQVAMLQSPFMLTRDEHSETVTFVFNVEVWKQVS